MKISEFLYALSGLESLVITNENGQPIPAHFHVTEVGQTTKNYIYLFIRTSSKEVKILV